MSDLWLPPGSRSSRTASPAISSTDTKEQQFMLYDSEILGVERVINDLKARADGGIDIDEFVSMAKERLLSEVGLVVEVEIYETNFQGVFEPHIVVQRRVEQGEFDHDRMKYEVRSDILETGDGGLIGPGGRSISAPKSVSFKK